MARSCTELPKTASGLVKAGALQRHGFGRPVGTSTISLAIMPLDAHLGGEDMSFGNSEIPHSFCDHPAVGRAYRPESDACPAELADQRYHFSEYMRGRTN